MRSMTPNRVIAMYKNERTEAKLGQQKFAIPRKDDAIIGEYTTVYYDGDMKRVNVNFIKDICFRLTSIRIKTLKFHDYMKLHHANCSIETLISKGYIYPVLVFLNGMFVPWENIHIVGCRDFYYMLLTNMDKEMYDRFNPVGRFDTYTSHTITLPDLIDYKVGGYDIGNRTMFAFNNNGELVTSGTADVVIDSTDRHVQIITEEFESSSDDQSFIIPDADQMYKYFTDNVFAFTGENFYNGDAGISVLGTAIRVTGGSSVVKIFRNTNEKVTPTYDNIRKVDINNNSEAILKALAGSDDAPSWAISIKDSFDPPFDRFHSNEENNRIIREYITRYDALLFNRVYQENSPIVNLEVTSQWLFMHKDEAGYFHIPSRFQDGIDFFVIVMVNGELCKNYRFHFYRTGYFYMPLDGIGDNDSIEIIYFKSARNFEMRTVIEDDDDFLPLDKKLYNGDLRIFSRKYNGAPFNFRRDGAQAFMIEHFFEKHANAENPERDNYIRIRLNDEYYYGKPLTLVSSKRFKYFCYTMEDPNAEDPQVKEINIVFNGQKVVFTPTGDIIHRSDLLNGKIRKFTAIMNDTPYTFEIDGASYDEGDTTSFKIKSIDPKPKFSDANVYDCVKIDGNFDDDYSVVGYIRVNVDGEIFEFKITDLYGRPVYVHDIKDGLDTVYTSYEGIAYQLRLKFTRDADGDIIDNPKVIISNGRNAVGFGMMFDCVDLPDDPEAEVTQLSISTLDGDIITFSINKDDDDLALRVKDINEGNLEKLGWFNVDLDGVKYIMKFTKGAGEDGSLKVCLDFADRGAPNTQEFISEITFNYISDYRGPYFKVDLGNTFKYCTDYNSFAVFFNGKRLSQDMYRLVLPCRPTTPFDKAMLYLGVPMEVDDRIEVFYLPTHFVDVFDESYDAMDENGTIRVQKSMLRAPIDKSLYMVWVNNKKLPASSIKNIDSTTMQIVTDLTNRSNVRITTMLDDDSIYEELESVFKDTEKSKWDEAVAQNGDHFSLMGIQKPTITDDDPDSFPANFTARALMYEIIRDWYLNNDSIDPTGVFLYDYVDVDSTAVAGTDPAGNTLLGVADYYSEDNVDMNRLWK